MQGLELNAVQMVDISANYAYIGHWEPLVGNVVAAGPPGQRAACGG